MNYKGSRCRIEKLIVKRKEEEYNGRYKGGNHWMGLSARRISRDIRGYQESGGVRLSLQPAVTSNMEKTRECAENTIFRNNYFAGNSS